jgi:hypothetical protein
MLSKTAFLHSAMVIAATTDIPPMNRNQCVIGWRACILNSRTMTGSTDIGS